MFYHVCRLVIQRTKRVDDAQEMTFILLELLTSGTFIERQKFVVICIEKLANVPATDQSSPVYILEEICRSAKFNSQITCFIFVCFFVYIILPSNTIRVALAMT